MLGPHGLEVFSNAKADVELGDFGILFLLFSEGLEVSSQRLRKLSNYLPLGFAQISLTTGVITAAILLGGPQLLDRVLPLDEGFIDVTNPTEAVVLALAGTLSTSAFIFPVLKERGWEADDAGQAATSILLLQVSQCVEIKKISKFQYFNISISIFQYFKMSNFQNETTILFKITHSLLKMNIKNISKFQYFNISKIHSLLKMNT